MGRAAYRALFPVLVFTLAFVVVGREGSHEIGPAAAAPLACGIQRWNIKTLQDGVGRSANFSLRRSSVRELRWLRRWGSPGRERLHPVELRAYRLQAARLSTKLEPDEDIHLVIAEPSRPHETMIVEFPSESCTPVAWAARRQQMRRARAALVRACGPPLSSRFQPLAGRAGVARDPRGARGPPHRGRRRMKPAPLRPCRFRALLS